MQALAWILRFFVVVILVWFALKNSQLVDIHGLPEQRWQAPLAFVLLVAFVSGVVIGLLAWIPTIVRQRREIGRLKRASAHPPTVAAVAPLEPGDAAAPSPPPAPALPAQRPGSEIHGI